MTDLTLLDGNVDDVKKGLKGLDANALAALLAAEQAGKTRKGVIDAIEEAQTAASTGAVAYTSTTDRGNDEETTTTTDVSAPAAAITTAASLDHSPEANIAPATEFEPSGAPLQTSEFDTGHVAVDANPRANTTEDQNRIDFNDPVRSGQQIVEDALGQSSAN